MKKAIFFALILVLIFFGSPRGLDFFLGSLSGLLEDIVGLKEVFGATQAFQAFGANQKAFYEPNQLLVRLKNNSKLYELKLPQGTDVLERAELVRRQPEIKYAEPNWQVKIVSLIPNDSFYSQAHHLWQIKAAEAWEFTQGSEDIVIAFPDTGIDLDHPDLRENLWRNPDEVEGDGLDNDGNGFIDDVRGWDFVDNDSIPEPTFEEGYLKEGIHHGTLVAGVALAQGGNREGIVGVSWHSKIMPLRVLNSQGLGNIATVVKGIDYAIQKKADILNLSFVGTNKSEILEEVLGRAYQAGLIIVAAAGNDSTPKGALKGGDLDALPYYPVCIKGEKGEDIILGVGAVDSLDQKANFSNFGSCLDLVAPGVDLYSTQFYEPEKGEDFSQYYGKGWSGTSLSAPQVAGAVALLKSYNPSLNQIEIGQVLKESALNIDFWNPLYIGRIGAGRLDLNKALVQVQAKKTPSATRPDQLSQNTPAALQSTSGTKEIVPSQIITAAGQGEKPYVRVFSSKGVLERQFLAYASYFRGGVNLATGDLDGDGVKEVITGAGRGGGPHVRIFDSYGRLKGQFFAYEEKFRGGVEVAVADINGDGLDEIITGTGFSGGPQVRVFDSLGKLKLQFFAFDKSSRGGVKIAAADLDGDKKAEIIAGAGRDGEPWVKIFSLEGRLEQLPQPSREIEQGRFLAYGPNYRGGVKVAAADVDGDGQLEVITGTETGGGPQVRIFTRQGELKSHFFAYASNFRGGVEVKAADFNGDGKDEIITGPGFGGGPQVRVFDYSGKPKVQFFAFEETLRGGVKVGGL